MPMKVDFYDSFHRIKFGSFNKTNWIRLTDHFRPAWDRLSVCFRWVGVEAESLGYFTFTYRNREDNSP